MAWQAPWQGQTDSGKWSGQAVMPATTVLKKRWQKWSRRPNRRPVGADNNGCYPVEVTGWAALPCLPQPHPPWAHGERLLNPRPTKQQSEDRNHKGRQNGRQQGVREIRHARKQQRQQNKENKTASIFWSLLNILFCVRPRTYQYCTYMIFLLRHSLNWYIPSSPYTFPTLGLSGSVSLPLILEQVFQIPMNQ